MYCFHEQHPTLHPTLHPTSSNRFSSSGAVTATDTLLHEFFASKCVKVTDPVYLAVDTTLQHDTLSIKAYIAKSLTLGQQQVAMEFREVPCTVNTTQAERIGRMLLFLGCAMWLSVVCRVCAKTHVPCCTCPMLYMSHTHMLHISTYTHTQWNCC